MWLDRFALARFLLVASKQTSSHALSLSCLFGKCLCLLVVFALACVCSFSRPACLLRCSQRYLPATTATNTLRVSVPHHRAADKTPSKGHQKPQQPANHTSERAANNQPTHAPLLAHKQANKQTTRASPQAKQANTRRSLQPPHKATKQQAHTSKLVSQPTQGDKRNLRRTQARTKQTHTQASMVAGKQQQHASTTSASNNNSAYEIRSGMSVQVRTTVIRICMYTYLHSLHVY